MNTMDSKIKLIPLGGCGEIGMNMTLLSVEDRWFFIDGGALFADASQIGVDLILPDCTFLDEQNIQPEAWLITHGHEDHIGALPYLFRRYPAPIYGTEFTIELIKAKFTEAGITDAVFHVWKFNKPTLFRKLQVTPFSVNHSIAEAAGLFMETQWGNVLHMGDFRIDYAPPEKTTTHENLKKVLKNKSVTLMMSDSTNSFQKGTDKSETAITPILSDYFKKKTGAVIIATFASNIWRLQSVFDAAKESKRKVLLFGRTLFRNIEIAERLGLLKFSPDIFVSLQDVESLPRDRVCILCTGSQGESFSGLHRLAWGNVPEFQIQTQDSVFMSSRIIPGNEKSIDAVVTQLARIGCDVVTTKEDGLIHVSGHGYAEDLKKCIQIAKPTSFMPVHGTYRHLKKHRELAIECGVSPERCYLVENGDVVFVAPEPIGVVAKVESGRDYVCPGGVYSQHSSLYKERVSLVRTGVVSVCYLLNGRNMQTLSQPVFQYRGLEVEDGLFAKKLVQIYEQTFEVVSKRKKYDLSVLQEQLRIAIRRFIENRYGLKTTVLVLIQIK
jgi:ribonuclease J